jgi:peptidase E
MKLLLSSCDFGNPKSAQIIKDNLCKPLSDCRVLYFPNEKATPEKIRSGKYETRLTALGFTRKNIYVANYFAPQSFFDLDIDLIYISGGNTFGTMKRIRESGFDRAIIDYVQRGVIYVGGSAGAHIVSADIAHVAKYDKDTFGLTDFSGLGLFQGILICHYTDERKADFEALAATCPYIVRALTDEDCIIVRDD